MRKDELQEEVSRRGLYLDSSIKWNNDNIIKFLGDDYLSKNENLKTFGTCYAQHLDNVATCKHFKDNEKDFTEELSPLTNENWIAEVKENGFRIIAIYCPTTGFEFFSRKTSVRTFLNTNLTEKILFIKNGLVRQP
jgi:hypothetical protein